MTNDHLVVEDARLCLATVDNHSLLVDCCNMILARTGAKTSRFALRHAPLVRVKLE
jgi:hypothetical protein